MNINKNSLAPIALFVFNRPEHTQKVVEALLQNTLAAETELFIFSDAPRKEADIDDVNAVRDFIKSIKGFKSIKFFEADKNIGCADSIIKGITKVFETNDKAIIVEDDIVTAPNFLEYMNSALNKYENDERIYSVSGFNIPKKVPKDYNSSVYLAYRNSSWGWGTWKKMWDDVDWNFDFWQAVKNDEKLRETLVSGGNDLPYMLKLQAENKIDAWDIRFCTHHILKNRFTLFPVKSFVKNIGLDGTGVHCGKSSKFNEESLADSFSFEFPDVIMEDKIMIEYQKSFFKYTVWDKLRRFLKDLLKYKVKK